MSNYAESRKHYNYNEFNFLTAYLKYKDLDYRVEPFMDGAQVAVYDRGNIEWDVVIHQYSYGSDKGLLELMNRSCKTLRDFCPFKEVQGYLKALDIIKAFEEGDQYEQI